MFSQSPLKRLFPLAQLPLIKAPLHPAVPVASPLPPLASAVPMPPAPLPNLEEVDMDWSPVCDQEDAPASVAENQEEYAPAEDAAVPVATAAVSWLQIAWKAAKKRLPKCMTNLGLTRAGIKKRFASRHRRHHKKNAGDSAATNVMNIVRDVVDLTVESDMDDLS
jgi:hypothetical protein